MNFEFRERALAEARRYGSDSWVFIRELLQNARDAGARRIDFSAGLRGETEILRCRDDGGGMSLEHARRYLFALYASSKDGDARQAGQFGVGFWSVLRFRPERVVIRSRPRGGSAWQVTLDGDLASARFAVEEGPADFAVGTEVLLERRRRDRPLTGRLEAAIRRYGRFLTAIDDQARDLPIFLDDRPLNAPFALEAPSSGFRRRGWRGVVALGETPRVELFANGLFVREAACLDDLLDEEAGRRGPGRGSLTLPGSVAPQIYLDSNRLELLLARSDARQDRHLRRLIERAEKELEGLITRQLAALQPQPWYERSWPGWISGYSLLASWGRIRDLGSKVKSAAFWRHWLRDGRRRFFAHPWRSVAVVAAFLLTALALWQVVAWLASRGKLPSWPWSVGAAGLPAPDAAASAGPAPGFDDAWPWDWRGSWGGNADSAGSFEAGRRSVWPYADLGRIYRGPRLDPLGAGDTPPLALAYRPAALELYLAALVIEDPGLPPPPARPAGPYTGPDCGVIDCVELLVEMAPATGWSRLPVPTGYLVDPRSVYLAAVPLEVMASAGGEALIEPLGTGGVLRYAVAPSAAPVIPSVAAGEPIPAPLESIAYGLRSLPAEERIQTALDEVARRVAYDRTLESALRHREFRRQGLDLVTAALAVGGGDCDIQNGVLVELLRRSGVDARLAIGWVGRGGGVISSLHAWVEYHHNGRWRVADVSARFSSSASVQKARSRVRVPSRSGDGDRSPGTVWRSRWLLASAALIPVALLTLFLLSRRVSRDLRLSSESDLAGLVAGALEHPELARLPILRFGRLVPLIDGGALSLDAARRLSDGGRLFSSARSNVLVREASRRHRIIDAATPEGRVTSLGLGAIEVDEWEDLLGRCRESPLLDRFNRYAAELGPEGCQIGRGDRVDRLGRPLMMLDLASLLGGERRWLIDGELVDELSRELERRPARALFLLLDRVVEELDLAPENRARLLAPAARQVVLEDSPAEGSTA